MSDFLLTTKCEQGVGIITLNRVAKRNAMNGPMVSALRDAFKSYAQDPAIKVVLLTGAGEHFCAGGDIQWMCEMATLSYDENYTDALMLADLMYELYIYRKPTVVLAHGITLGGGLGLLATCDIALGADNAQFGFAEVNIGLTPSTISPYVVRAMGERAARYYFLTGERFNATIAERTGILHAIVPAADLYDHGLTLAKQLAQQSSQAMMAAKKLVRAVAAETITMHTIQMTADHLAKQRASTDAQEGLKAFIEKRSPRWS